MWYFLHKRLNEASNRTKLWYSVATATALVMWIESRIAVICQSCKQQTKQIHDAIYIFQLKIIHHKPFFNLPLQSLQWINLQKSDDTYFFARLFKPIIFIWLKYRQRQWHQSMICNITDIFNLIAQSTIEFIFERLNCYWSWTSTASKHFQSEMFIYWVDQKLYTSKQSDNLIWEVPWANCMHIVRFICSHRL